jgi:hypothetical protein
VNTLGAGNYTVQLTYAGDANYTAATAISASVQVGQGQPTIDWPTPSAMVYGASLSGVLNAQAMNGSTVVPGSAVYTATRAGGSPMAVTAGSVLAAGTYTLNVTITPTDTTDFKAASGSVILTVSQATASVALQASVNPVLTQNPVTLMATVSSTAGTPTGTVMFYNGTTALTSATNLNSNGVATLTTTSLPIGADSITAVYSGDTNFVSGTSSAVAENVEDFNLTVSTTQGSLSSITLNPGQTATYDLVVSPQAPATTFPALISLSLSGLPAGASATFNPSTLPAGSSSTPVTLTIQIPNQSATNAIPSKLQRTGLPVALGMLFLPFAARMRRTARRLRKIAVIAFVSIALAGSIFGLTGCGGKSSGFFGQSPQTYNLTVTATSGSLTHSTNVNLTVE